MRRKKYGRVFAGSFCVTVCLLLLGTGFVWAEYNTRCTTGESAELIPAYTWQDGAWQSRNLSIPEWITAAAETLSPAARAVLLVFEWECDAVSRWASGPETVPVQGRKTKRPCPMPGRASFRHFISSSGVR
ncbi:MAG: hypothetical protein IKI50_02150 [Clostridia bacterium]|nr:hypothetical protein [Clostridia bacterium]